MRTLEPDTDIILTDGTFRITGRMGNRYELMNMATGRLTTTHIGDLTERLESIPSAKAVAPRALDALDAQDQVYVSKWAAHIEEMISGNHPGHDMLPQYNPSSTTLNNRIESKVAQLRMMEWPASRATLLRKKREYETHGPAGLIDGRKNRRVGVFDRADGAVVEAMATVIARQTNKSTVSKARLHEMTRIELVMTSPGTEMPSRATTYRHTDALSAGKATSGSATARRSKAGTPDRMYRTNVSLLPGQVVLCDSNVMDVFVRTDTGVQRPILTVFIDSATRSIIGSTIRLVATKGYDHALLVAQTLVPYQARPDRSEQRTIIAFRNPAHPLLNETERRRLEATRPFIYPRRIITDNGKDYLSNVFGSACREFGIELTRSAVHTPTDKAIIERTFASISHYLLEKLPGFLANTPANRGLAPDRDNDMLDVGGLTELFDDWVLSMWQNRSHTGLRDPFEPTIKYTPNQWYSAAADLSGPINIPLGRDDFIGLMPTVWKRLTPTGVNHNLREYDSPELVRYHGTASNVPGKSRKWEVKYNPYDETHVWVRSPENKWIECRWRRLDSLKQPFVGEIYKNLRDQERAEVVTNQSYLEGTTIPVGAAARDRFFIDASVDSGEILELSNWEDDEDQDEDDYYGDNIADPAQMTSDSTQDRIPK